MSLDSSFGIQESTALEPGSGPKMALPTTLM